ncbi:CHRD domain-containing protein [Candidatus Woesebacteria bacterium]|nr:CHRD domain-containing protein [Candidatus Woesebacteria bacterium]
MDIKESLVKRLFIVLCLSVALSVSVFLVKQTTFLLSRAFSHPEPVDFYPITSTLTGSQEVPPNVSNAKGYARMYYSFNTKQLLSIGISVSGIAKSQLTGSHIHVGPPGVNGEIIVDLGPPESWVEVSPYELRRSIQSVSFPLKYEPYLLEGKTYMNIHTLTYPQGEIRGQLKVASTLTPIITLYPTKSLTPSPTPIPLTYFPTFIPTRTPTPYLTPFPTRLPTPTFIFRTPTPGLTFFPTIFPTRIITPTIPPILTGGDANCDGRVNLADFSIWREFYVQRIPPPYVCPKDPDFNNDGRVNLNDLLIWLSNFLNRPRATPTP